MKRLWISTCERSGEQQASAMLDALAGQGWALGQNVEVRGLGGDTMAAQGVQLVNHVRDLSVMGFVDVVKALPRVLRVLRRAKRSLRTWKPDVLVCVDAPDFNLRLAAYARRLGITVVYHVSPQVWAWRAKRLKTIPQCVDHMCVLFPFEKELYIRVGCPVSYVGHPLLPRWRDGQGASEPLPSQLPEGSTVLTCLLGSREGEVERCLPSLREVLSHCPKDWVVLFPVAQSLSLETVRARLERLELKQPWRVCSEACLHTALLASQVALVVSGTVTLHVAMAGCPMVVVYRMPGWQHWLAKRWVKLPSISLPNVVVGHAVVAEQVQDAWVPETTAATLKTLATPGRERAAACSGLAEVRAALSVPPDRSLSQVVATALLGRLNDLT